MVRSELKSYYDQFGYTVMIAYIFILSDIKLRGFLMPISRSASQLPDGPGAQVLCERPVKHNNRRSRVSNLWFARDRGAAEAALRCSGRHQSEWVAVSLGVAWDERRH